MTMKPKDKSPLPHELEECQRAFIPRKSYHSATPPLTLEELRELMPDTFIFVDGEQEFKTMLPRFFELAWRAVVKGESLELDPLSPLQSYNWHNWPDEQRHSIEHCLLLLWREAIERENAFILFEIFIHFQSTELSWLPFLEIWLASPLSAAALSFALPSTDWKKLAPEVRQWLCQPRVLARIEADFFAATDPEEASDISRLADLLRFHCSQA